MDNDKRGGHFTSSNAHKLVKMGRVLMTPEEKKKWKEKNPRSTARYKDGGFSEAGLTYIQEVAIERRLGKCLDASDVYTRAIAWGEFIEYYLENAVDNFGVEYKAVTEDTKLHPKYGEFWSGTADYIVSGNCVSELKSYQLKKFAQYTDLIIKPITEEYTIEKKIEEFKGLFEFEYWQIVSNAIINKVPNGEAMTFMPYESEFEALKEVCEDYCHKEEIYPRAWRYYYIANAESPKDLPMLKDGGYYKNLNRFRFKIPKKDINFLTSRMIEANKLLVKDV